jgi:glycosyltransferase involved in cell wall biosynthesis
MLESVKEQGDCIAKHIIMDGGSTDGTVERLKEWAAQNPYFEFVSEKDNGQADACQKALNRVETEYFIWLNADDVLLPGAAEKLLSKVSETDHASIVYGDYVRIDGEGKIFAKRRQPTYNYWDCLHGYLFVQNAAAMFNAIKLREAGGFNPSLRFVMDYDVILKLGKIGPVKHVKEFCGAFRVHETSKTSTIDDVCQKETLELRIKYGVSTNRVVRGFCEILVKLRVSLRMLIQGCMKDRLY